MKVAAFVVLVVGFTIVSGSTAATDPWKALYRPLEVPRLSSGKGCPVSPVDRSVDFDRFGIGTGIGSGPAYPAGLGDGVLGLAPPRNFQSRTWAGQKVLWFVHPRYRGPLLIRGRQLDGPYRVRFERGATPPKELRIAPGESVQWTGQPEGSRGRPSYTRLRAGGCYGYQIDGTTFTRVVIFRAEWPR